MPNDNENRNLRIPRIEIVEQPAPKALRFRYECEGRSAGSIPGVNSTPENKTYPTIRIVGYTGNEDIVVIVSCVTKDPPYRAHPHNLVGRECKDGICSIYIDKESMTATFSNLGVQCVKKKEIEAALKLREEKKVDPYKQGFDHAAHPSSIDLNSVRLCFQAIIKGKNTRFLGTVVSDPIYDKKAMSDLQITRLSHSSAPAKGGSEIILLCEKVAKEDIKIRFFEEADGHIVWESFGDITIVHKQVAIAVKTPAYRIPEISKSVDAYIQLYRPTDRTTSDAVSFKFTPYEPDYPRRKTPKLLDELRQIEQKKTSNSVLQFDNNSHLSPIPVKTEPCASPDFLLPHSPASSDRRTISPYNGQVRSPYAQTIFDQGTSQLPPFDVLPNSNVNVGPSGTDVFYQQQPFMNMKTYCGGTVIQNDFASNLGNQLIMMNVAQNTQNQVSMYADENMQVFDQQMNVANDEIANPVASLEIKLDTNELLNPDSVQQNIAIELSENLTQALSISGDSLVRLANETFEQNFNQH